ncbi:MAG: hypothetical protein C0623_05930 [Desulfuromonas sp.]|nr:MAG: hypothetical protein C0623_05930 [Desulfuromonas sp.]
MSRSGGQFLLIALLLIILTIQLNRAPANEESPVFLFTQPGKVLVEFGSGFPGPGIHQIIDGSVWRGVINLTNRDVDYSVVPMELLQKPVLSGARVDLVIKSDMIKELSISWMSAAKRAALGIPLHPDRMCEEDWLFLPGIGEKTALRIVNNRQKYGEFGSLSGLQRVPGIGKKSLSAWNQYFFTDYDSAK